MKRELSADEERILNDLLNFLPLKEKFTLYDIYFRKVIAPKFYPKLIVMANGSITGSSIEAEKERHDSRQNVLGVESYLVDNDFADRAVDGTGILLTDKGKMLTRYKTLKGYLGFELRKQHAKENAQIATEELVQSQIDYFAASIKNQEKQDELNNSQLKLNVSQIVTNKIANEANKTSKNTNRYIAIFTAFAGGWYLYDLIYRVASEKTVVRHLSKLNPHYDNLKFIGCLLITFFIILCIYLRLNKLNHSTLQIDE